MPQASIFGLTQTRRMLTTFGGFRTFGPPISTAMDGTKSSSATSVPKVFMCWIPWEGCSGRTPIAGTSGTLPPGT